MVPYALGVGLLNLKFDCNFDKNDTFGIYDTGELCRVWKIGSGKIKDTSKCYRQVYQNLQLIHNFNLKSPQEYRNALL